MSIASAIQTKQTQVASAYTSCNNKGATMPASADRNMSNMATTINSIQTEIPVNQLIEKWRMGTTDGESLTNSTVTSEDYSNYGTSGATRGFVYISLSNFTTFTGTVSVKSDSILKYGIQLRTTNLQPNTAAGSSLYDTGWKGQSTSATVTQSNASTALYMCLVATYIDAGTGIPTLQEFIDNATFSLSVSLLDDSTFIREDESVSANYTQIPSSKFSGNKTLISVLIPDTVTTIGRWAFQNCTNLQYVNCENITNLNGNAFSATSITEVYMPKLVSVQTLEGSFCNCKSLKKVTSLGSVTTLSGNPSNSNGFFLGCSELESVVLPSTLTTIQGSVFASCPKLTTINIPESVTSIGQFAFANSPNIHIDNLYLPNLNSVHYAAFDNGSTTHPYILKITSLGNLTSIPTGSAPASQGVFSRFTGLTEINLHEGITSIGECALQFCSSLPSITIPSTVTYFGRWALRSCTSLVTITCLPTTPPTLYDNQVFTGCSSLTTIYVPSDSVSAYQTATNWTTYASKIQAMP